MGAFAVLLLLAIIFVVVRKRRNSKKSQDTEMIRASNPSDSESDVGGGMYYWKLVFVVGDVR